MGLERSADEARRAIRHFKAEPPVGLSREDPIMGELDDLTNELDAISPPPLSPGQQQAKDVAQR